jgi:hypothetical protein
MRLPVLNALPLEIARFNPARLKTIPQINCETVYNGTEMRLDKVQNPVRKLTRLDPPHPSEPSCIGSVGADEFPFSVVVYSVSSSIAEAWARGRGRYRGVLQSPRSAS